MPAESLRALTIAPPPQPRRSDIVSLSQSTIPPALLTYGTRHPSKPISHRLASRKNHSDHFLTRHYKLSILRNCQSSLVVSNVILLFQPQSSHDYEINKTSHVICVIPVTAQVPLSTIFRASFLATPILEHRKSFSTGRGPAITTVSRFFTDKALGAGPQDSSQQIPSPPLVPQKRPTILQRLHLHNASRKAKPKPLTLDIRPTTSSSLPIPSSDSSRATSSHSDAVTIAEITQMMPQSLTLSTPPSGSNKRQRSSESRHDPSRPGSAGQQTQKLVSNGERLAQRGIRMPMYLNKTKAEIQSSFQDLEWKQRYRLAAATSHASSAFKLDRSAVVTSRNRYGNVQPWEASRIKLSDPINGSDYINASPIALPSLQTTSGRRGRPNSGTHSRERLAITRYVATQGPKADQIPHFWHMVMQQSTGEVGVIIMLTQCYEGLKEKCTRYFPPDMDNPTIKIAPERKAKTAVSSNSTQNEGTSEGTLTEVSISPQTEPNPSEDDDYTQAGTVELLSLINDTNTRCEIRQLRLTFGEHSKTIYHYFYGSWADFGKPEAEDRVALLELMRVSRKVAAGSPRIVHCSAGVGRTGTWIALDWLLHELEEGRLLEDSYFDRSPPNQAVVDVKQDEKAKSRSRSRKPPSQTQAQARDKPADTWGNSGPPKSATSTTPEPKDIDLIHDTVDRLRIQRMMMVMNELQYSFLYEALREAFLLHYAEKEAGVVVTGTDTEEPSPKIARTESAISVDANESVDLRAHDVLGTTAAGQNKPDNQSEFEDTTLSEAETEIQDGGKPLPMEVERDLDLDNDPYKAAAPQYIREGMKKTEQ